MEGAWGLGGCVSGDGMAKWAAYVRRCGVGWAGLAAGYYTPKRVVVARVPGLMLRQQWENDLFWVV